MKLAVALLGLGLLAGCPNEARNNSIQAANKGAKDFGNKDFENAITDYKKAVDGFKDNHLAWYGLGASYANRQEWAQSADAFQEAVQLEPDQAMYNMWYGVALYEKAVQGAREDQARKENKKPEDIKPDLSAVSFEKPLQFLTQAVKLNPDMWRAHYYLGRIYRATDKPKDAATEFSSTLKANPREPGPYVALGELYRKWDYTDAAIKVAQAGTANVIGSQEVSDIWYVLGMGYDDKQMETEAIDAFGKALDSRRDNHQAQFQRGQAYFRKGDLDKAKTDLEAFSKSSGASLDFAKQQASKLLMDISAKKAGADAPAGGALKSPEDLVKGAAANKPPSGGPPPRKK
jgi:tetratricopeptide (TPR) repeat protein